MQPREMLLEIEADALFRLLVVQIMKQELAEPNPECEEQVIRFAEELKDSALSIVAQTVIEDQAEQLPEDVKHYMEAFIASINTEEIANYITNKKAKAREGGSLDT
jgi:hypothetical protein